jgi:hypothetical protein
MIYLRSIIYNSNNNKKMAKKDNDDVALTYIKKAPPLLF